MKWKTKEASFKYNGKPVTRHTATAQTPTGEFRVYEAVGGRVFMIHPFIIKVGGLLGYDPDPDNTFGTPKILVQSLEDGIARCEAKWKQVKEAINKV
jgi:hypothetical protein